jgi:hypothetical protein
VPAHQRILEAVTAGEGAAAREAMSDPLTRLPVTSSALLPRSFALHKPRGVSHVTVHGAHRRAGARSVGFGQDARQ